MFKELGQMASLMKNMPKIKEEMEKFQKRLPQMSAFGESGGGVVQVEVNGNLELTRCLISQHAMNPESKELLQDLIRGAVNLACHRMREQIAVEMSRVAQAAGLPPGMGLPGGLGLPGLPG